MSTSNRQYSLALEALAELKVETAPRPTQPVPVAPTLNDVLTELGPLPREALFLGIASDGLPVLLNLHDPLPGPVLVTGESGSGKTTFLRTVAQGVLRTHPPEDVQFGVITAHKEDWEQADVTPHQVGIFSPYHSDSQDFLLSLASWAHTNKNTRQSVLLLIDDLEAVANLDFDAVQNLRWLLLRGPSRRVWPLISMSAERYGQVLAWIQIFRTRIFGRIEREQIAAALGGDNASALDQLQAGIQFCLRENGNWLRFWLPSL